MSNEPTPSNSNNKPDRETFTGPPRWVKIFAIATGILILVAVAVMLLGGGEHGPARHGFGLEEPSLGAGAALSQDDPRQYHHGIPGA